MRIPSPSSPVPARWAGADLERAWENTLGSSSDTLCSHHGDLAQSCPRRDPEEARQPLGQARALWVESPPRVPGCRGPRLCSQQHPGGRAGETQSPRQAHSPSDARRGPHKQEPGSSWRGRRGGTPRVRAGESPLHSSIVNSTVVTTPHLPPEPALDAQTLQLPGEPDPPGTARASESRAPLQLRAAAQRGSRERVSEAVCVEYL